MAAVQKLEHAGAKIGEGLEQVVDETHEQELHAATATGLDHRKLGVWAFIASETIFFAALIATYLVYRGKTPYEEGLEHLHTQDALTVATVNTFILLASSLTMVLSLSAIERANKRRMIVFLILTALFGLVFLSGQAFEYSKLYSEGLTFDSNLFTSTFFTLTGFHGSHVFVGVIWITMLIIRALRGGIGEHNHLAVELGGLYWHFVDLVWVVLFTIIYLI